MTKPAIKTAAQPLVHHPSDALDLFCRYDGSHEAWAQFDQSLSDQLRDFEAKNRAWFTPKAIRGEFKKSLGR